MLMKRLIFRLLPLACAATVLTTISAQSVVMLDLGAEVVVMTPDAKVALPLTLSTTGEGPVKVTIEIAFATGSVGFADATAATSLDVSGGKVRSTIKPAAADATEQTVTIEIDSPRPLTSGALASLNFTVLPGAKPETEIQIRQVSRTATTAGGQALTTRGADGLITLVEAPQACFFYMH